MFFIFDSGIIPVIVACLVFFMLFILFPSFMFLLFVAGFIWLLVALFKMLTRDDRNGGE